MKHLTLFETSEAYNATTLDLPNVSLIEENMSVSFNPYVEPFFCKLTLNDDSVVELEGSGELTSAMISEYTSTIVGAEIGTQCKSIGNGAFNNCSGLTSIVIPDSVSSIGSTAFGGCSGLISVTIPDSVTSIGGEAFAGCSGLTSITISNSVTSIGGGAFRYCRGLTSITIGNGVTGIGSSAFDYCSSLSTITSYIMTAPSVNPGTFSNVSNGGTLYVPIGSSGYDTWMNNQGNLGFYNWTKVEQ